MEAVVLFTIFGTFIAGSANVIVLMVLYRRIHQYIWATIEKVDELKMRQLFIDLIFESKPGYYTDLSTIIETTVMEQIDPKRMRKIDMIMGEPSFGNGDIETRAIYSHIIDQLHKLNRSCKMISRFRHSDELKSICKNTKTGLKCVAGYFLASKRLLETKAIDYDPTMWILQVIDLRYWIDACNYFYPTHGAKRKDIKCLYKKLGGSRKK